MSTAEHRQDLGTHLCPQKMDDDDIPEPGFATAWARARGEGEGARRACGPPAARLRTSTGYCRRSSDQPPSSSDAISTSSVLWRDECAAGAYDFTVRARPMGKLMCTSRNSTGQVVPVERSGFVSVCRQATIIFSFVIGIASKKVCIGVLPKHQRP